MNFIQEQLAKKNKVNNRFKNEKKLPGKLAKPSKNFKRTTAK